jgi:hypothetical protein
MTRGSCRWVVAALALGLAAGALAPLVSAGTAAGPFYFTPSPTKECAGLTNCIAKVGPWVVVPPGGEATFELGCPTLFGYLIGGTDARASSGDVRVWFDGDLGAPIGHTGIQGAMLLFHAVTDSGRSGAFQPILGCIALKQQNKISTISYLKSAAVPGVPAGAPVQLRPRVYLLKPFKVSQRPFYTAHCAKNEKLVGTWDALAFQTAAPPTPTEISAIRVEKVVVGDTVYVDIQRTLSRHLPPQAEVQYGAMCVS